MSAEQCESRILPSDLGGPLLDGKVSQMQN